MKKTLAILLSILVCTNAFTVSANSRDEEAPTVSLKTNIVVKINDTIELKNYITVEDSSEVKILSLSEKRTDQTGEYSLEIYAVDSFGNSTTESLYYNVLNEEDYENYLESLKPLQSSNVYTFNAYELNTKLAEVNATTSFTSAYDLATQFVGMGGSCDKVAQSFINSLMGPGHSIYNGYVVDVTEAQPGDIIYYYDGGFGIQHYAVYLGGDTALQGNFNGTTVIGSVYLNNATVPVFFRPY